MNNYWIRRWSRQLGWIDIYRAATNITTILRAELSRQHKTNGRERLIFIIKVN